MIAELSPPKKRLLEWMKGRRVLLAISAIILVAALIGVGVLIGEVVGPKSAWVLWVNTSASSGGSSATAWGIVSAHESKRECERGAEALGKIHREEESQAAKGVFDPLTGNWVKVQEQNPVKILRLYSCFPPGVDPRGR